MSPTAPPLDAIDVRPSLPAHKVSVSVQGRCRAGSFPLHPTLVRRTSFGEKLHGKTGFRLVKVCVQRFPEKAKVLGDTLLGYVPSAQEIAEPAIIDLEGLWRACLNGACKKIDMVARSILQTGLAACVRENHHAQKAADVVNLMQAILKGLSHLQGHIIVDFESGNGEYHPRVPLSRT